MQAKILPRSEVGVANTRTPFPAIVKIPTVFSGLAYKFNSFSLKLQQDIYITTIKCVRKRERECWTWVLAPEMRLTASD